MQAGQGLQSAAKAARMAMGPQKAFVAGRGPHVDCRLLISTVPALYDRDMPLVALQTREPALTLHCSAQQFSRAPLIQRHYTGASVCI